MTCSREQQHQQALAASIVMKGHGLRYTKQACIYKSDGPWAYMLQLKNEGLLRDAGGIAAHALLDQDLCGCPDNLHAIPLQAQHAVLCARCACILGSLLDP